MKKIYSILTLLLLTVSVFLTQQATAQAPQKMSYQSVLRNSSNALLVNTAVGIKISVLQGSASGTAVYEETQTATTKTNSLVIVPYAFQSKIVIDTVNDFTSSKINLPL
jgi:hypothetical protein